MNIYVHVKKGNECSDIELKELDIKKLNKGI